ncbi:DUF5615 family PIN-like protein [Rhodohalobacter halophilus]|uniref:DUF5615 family PIN-like protein n=1 Tax=Rhodohalobacter halophilus TaxID=1812810 RepID=UPI00159EF6B1|nr:DUF5615 family PIN-like protein [Rhodohalobacter halophilus]
MPQYLVDANLPYYFSLWKGENFVHQSDLGDSWSDEKIWNYAKKHKLTIITKDADFSNRIMISDPPPKVVHLKVGNMSLNELYEFLSIHWTEILELSSKSKLVNVYRDRLYSID